MDTANCEAFVNRSSFEIRINRCSESDEKLHAENYDKESIIHHLDLPCIEKRRDSTGSEGSMYFDAKEQQS